ncbi:MAG TPA: tyrosine-type recombinase/integrase [Thermomicrobiaceae bacterium]|nr:tyrosine-type recombinase/integrase [Thermomicrobiaceae bacterium]
MNVAAWRPLAPAAVVTVLPPPLSPAEVTPLAEAFAQRSRADNTLRGYRTDWARWTAWAASNGVAAMPANPRAVEAWLCEEAATHTPGTLSRRVAALRLAHELAGHPTPIDSHVRRVLEGIRRTTGRPPRRVAPMMLSDLRAGVATLDLDTLAGLRDRALLTLGWAGAFRRSELVALRVDDVTWTEEGLRVMVRRSKTDQSGTGQILGIPHAREEHDDVCPPCSLADWLGTAGIDSGPIFRRLLTPTTVGPDAIRDKGIAELVQRVMYAAGIAGEWSGHSLRAGFATEAARHQMDALAISKQTRHRKLDTLAVYVREGDLFIRNPATEAGL